MKFLRFESEAKARAAFANYFVGTEWPVYIGQVAVDVVGVVFQPNGEVEWIEDVETPVLAPIPGWHINLSDRVPALQQYEVDPPATPSRIFAGSNAEKTPRIPHEVARWQAKLALMQRTDGQGVALWDRLQQLRESIADAEQQTLLDAAMHEVLNWKRSSPTVLWAAEQLDLTTQQVDELFVYAQALEL